MPRKKQPTRPFVRRVADYVLAHGECTVIQVMAGLRHSVSAPTAARRGRLDINKRGGNSRAYTLEKLIERGLRGLVNNALVECNRNGYLRRVRHGVYGPPLPKLYQSGESMTA